jgi:hypothetical protein
MSVQRDASLNVLEAAEIAVVSGFDSSVSSILSGNFGNVVGLERVFTFVTSLYCFNFVEILIEKKILDVAFVSRVLFVVLTQKMNILVQF